MESVVTEDEVLVKIHATAVTRADCATREANRRSGLAVTLLSQCQQSVQTVAKIAKALGVPMEDLVV